jgi:hypothetical protein
MIPSAFAMPCTAATSTNAGIRQATRPLKARNEQCVVAFKAEQARRHDDEGKHVDIRAVDLEVHGQFAFAVRAMHDFDGDSQRVRPGIDVPQLRAPIDDSFEKA